MDRIWMLLVLVAVMGNVFADTAGSISQSAPSSTMPMNKANGAMPANHPPAVPADTKLVNSGKVLEVIDSPMYTYLQVTSDKGPVWLAAYKSNIAKGATVKYSAGLPQANFFSKSLNRTFDTILFVDTIEQVKK